MSTAIHRSCQTLPPPERYGPTTLVDAAWRIAAVVVALVLPATAKAAEVCEVGGQPVSTSNGYTTAGKTGTMRCRDGSDGPLTREEEIRDGKFVGLVRRYRGGVLESEHSINDRGNREGRSREFVAMAGPLNPMLREETLRNSTTVGLARTWYPEGGLRRIVFHGDDGREQAVAGFTPQGRPSELRCGPTPMLAPGADDAAWCGHRGMGIVMVDLFDSKGLLRSRVGHERGERRYLETFHDNGKTRLRAESGSADGTERTFSVEGVRLREKTWTVQGDDTRRSRITTLEREFHETSGSLVRERRWLPLDRGSELQLEQSWYLNGQPRDKQEYLREGGVQIRRQTAFYDNGVVSYEGTWSTGRSGSMPTGLHRRFDMTGRLSAETTHDVRGRIARERSFDEAGNVVRDEELFEDGSRKAFAR